MKNQKGQFVLEAILLMVVFMGFLAFVTSYFDKNGVLASMVKGPWTNLAGMMQNGQWKPMDAGQITHPTKHGRHVTLEGEAQ